MQFADQFMRENPGSFADVLGDIGGFSSSSLVGPALPPAYSLCEGVGTHGRSLHEDVLCLGYSWVLSIRKCSSVRKGTVEH